MWKAIKYGLLFIGGLILGVIAIKQFSKIGRSESPKLWEPLPGHPDKIVLLNGKREVVKLPVNPNTGKQVTSDHVIAAGKTNGEVNVEILHETKERVVRCSTMPKLSDLGLGSRPD